MRFSYTALGPKRKKVRGTLNAEDKAEALDRLLSNNLVVLELRNPEESEEPKSFWQRDLNENDIHKVKIPKKKLLSLLNQFAIMMKAGVSLSMAMDVMIDSQKDKNILKILQEMDKDLFSGIPISESMKKFRAFPELIVSMVASGEENGRLDTAFEHCTGIIEKEIALNSKIRGAMGYPIFLLFLTIGLMIVMNVVVLPNFAGVFVQFGAQLPAITVFVMSVSNFLIYRGYILILTAAAVIAAYQIAKRQVPTFALKKDRFLLNIPVMGDVLRQSYISRFCRVMSSLVDAGVDIVQSLTISYNTVGNFFLKQALEEITEDVKIGVPIYASMTRFPVFDSLLVSMIRVGEESGMLSDSMDKMANLYEQQTDESTKRLTTMLEPAMTIVIALVVGTVIISIVVPMFGMYGVISGGT